jgi:hypothetical protein
MQAALELSLFDGAQDLFELGARAEAEQLEVFARD